MESIGFEDFKKLDLRVAEIVETREHPDADKLVVLIIKVGDEQKQLVAGIKAFYSLDELLGRKIVVVNNLEPVTLRGEESQGMLLAAREEEELGLVTVDKDIASGAVVS